METHRPGIARLCIAGLYVVVGLIAAMGCNYHFQAGGRDPWPGAVFGAQALLFVVLVLLRVVFDRRQKDHEIQGFRRLSSCGSGVH